MNALGRTFLNSRKDGKTEFFVRFRRTYVLNKRDSTIEKQSPL